MILLDYQNFLLNEGKEIDDKFEPQDIVDAVKKFASKMKIEEKRNSFEIWAYLSDRESQAAQINEVLKKNGFEIE